MQIFLMLKPMRHFLHTVPFPSYLFFLSFLLVPFFPTTSLLLKVFLSLFFLHRLYLNVFRKKNILGTHFKYFMFLQDKKIDVKF